MNLLFDIGNSKTKIAVVESQKIINIDTIDFKDLSVYLTNFKDNNVDRIWVAISKQDTNAASIKQMLNFTDKSKINFVKSQAQWNGLKNSYQNPAKLGIDRWLGLIYAWHTYKKATVIISCGTFITYDFVNNKGQYIGGLIMPGLQKSKYSTQIILKQPIINNKHCQLSSNTNDAINAGVNLSFIATINYLIDLNFADNILCTGGDALFAKQHSNKKINLVENIPLKGLLIIANSSNNA